MAAVTYEPVTHPARYPLTCGLFETNLLGFDADELWVRRRLPRESKGGVVGCWVGSARKKTVPLMTKVKIKHSSIMQKHY